MSPCNPIDNHDVKQITELEVLPSLHGIYILRIISACMSTASDFLRSPQLVNVLHAIVLLIVNVPRIVSPFAVLGLYGLCARTRERSQSTYIRLS
jgi:hypothetical protein